MSSNLYFVIDGDGFVSSDRHHEPQSFGSLKDAQTRAFELAQSEPLRTVTIAEARMHVTSAPKTTHVVKKIRNKRNVRRTSKARAHTQGTPAARD
jgi:hypothetical protein